MFDGTDIVLEEARLGRLVRSWVEDYNGSIDNLVFEDVAGFNLGCSKKNGDPNDARIDIVYQCDPAPHSERVNFNNLMFFKWVHETLESTAGDGYEYVVIV